MANRRWWLTPRARGAGSPLVHHVVGLEPGGGDQANSLTTDGMAVWAYLRVGTAPAPSASLSWTNTGGNVAFTTAIASAQEARRLFPLRG